MKKLAFLITKFFEKEATTGGLCRSVQQDGFTFDFTGHLLHASDPYFFSLLQSIVGLDTLNTISRRSFIYSSDTYTRYPYQINLHGLPTATIAECIEGFVLRKKTRTTAKTFPEWVLQNFGTGFAKHFFYPYQSKIFAYDIKKVTASWTGRFVPSTSLEQIIEGALSDNDMQSVGYNANFFYPKKGGIVAWVNQLAQQVTNPISTGFCVQSIDQQQKIVIFTNGHIEPYDSLISTMPLDVMLRMTKEKSSTHLTNAADKLLCNSVINFNLGVNNPDLSDKHWIYYPENQYPFYRIGFPHNFTPYATPEGCSSLYGEFAHVKKSERWVQTTLKDSIAQTKKLFTISEPDVLTQKIINIPHAYVIYDNWREQNLPKLLNSLEKQNIHSIGRYGQWKYSSMQEAVLDGKKIAQSLTVMPATQVHFIVPPHQIPQNQKELSS